MKRLVRFVTKLYPKAWRNRYGDEFEALLGDINVGWQSLFDVVWGGVAMQLRAWNAGRILITFAIVGSVIGFCASITVPKQYASDAVVQINQAPNHSPAADQAVSNRLNEVGRAALSRPKLEHMIKTFGLYDRERTNVQPEKAIQAMRKAITVKFVRSGQNAKPAFVIQFIYPDPALAQRVTQELVGSFMDQMARESSSNEVPMSWEIINPPNLPANPVDPNRWLMLTAGLIVGLLLGLLVAAFWRSPSMRHN